MKLQPLADNVVIRRQDAEKQTRGGIILPDTAQDKPQKGEVLAVGPGKRREDCGFFPMEVSVGDMVYFTKWSGNEVTIEGTDYIIMSANNILGKVTN